MLSELHKLFKLIWQKKKMLWLQTMKIYFFTVLHFKKLILGLVIFIKKMEVIVKNIVYILLRKYWEHFTN